MREGGGMILLPSQVVMSSIPTTDIRGVEQMQRVKI